jgi:O-antigen/teichoic acid export membrane protein
MGIALLALGFVESVASTGVDTALVAVREDVEHYIDPAFTIQLARGSAVMVLLWLAAPAIAWAFHTAAATSVIRAVGVVAVLRGLANPAIALALRRLDFQRVFWWSLPEAVTAVAVTVAARVRAARRLGARRRRRRRAGGRHDRVVRPGPADPAHRVRAHAHPPPAPVRQVRQRIARADVLQRLRRRGHRRHDDGHAHARLYQFASRIAELPVVTFTRAIAQVALPAAGGLHGTPLRDVWRTLAAWVLAVNGAAAAVIVVCGRVVVDAIAGAQWIDAVPLMQTLAFAMLFRAIVVLTGQLLDGAGRPRLTLRLNAVRLATLVVLLVPLAAWGGGAAAVAWGVLIANAGAALYALRLSSHAVNG